MLRFDPVKRKKGRKELQPAPGDLGIVHALLNTVNRKSGKDELESPRAVADWLARHGLLAATGSAPGRRSGGTGCFSASTRRSRDGSEPVRDAEVHQPQVGKSRTDR